MHSVNRFVICVVAAMAVNLTAGSALAQDAVTDVLQQRITLVMKNRSLGDVISHLGGTYGISFGFEESERDRGNHPVIIGVHMPDYFDRYIEGSGERIRVRTWSRYPVFKKPMDLDLKDATIASVIDELVKQLEGYEWSSQNGVINIFPEEKMGTRLGTVLDTRIASFSLKASERVGGIKWRLLRLSEIQKAAEKCGVDILFERNVGSDAAALDREFGTDVSFSNITLRDLMNEIASRKKGNWAIRAIPRRDVEYLDIEI